MADITIADAKEQLTKRREEGEALLEKYDKQKFRRWKRSVKTDVANIFGEDSRNLEGIEEIRFSPIVFTTGPSGDRAFDRARRSGIERTIAFLEAMEEEIDNYWHEEPETEAVVGEESVEGFSPGSTRKVFVVHGHDHGAKETVARFLSKLDLNPMILHEKANEGRSILGKIEAQEEDVGFAVVILTPDDKCVVGGDEEAEQPRARQNVVFELGFFTAALGRERVAALIHEDVEVPSDYDGIGYIPFASEDAEWKMGLTRELKAAGLDVDANKAFDV